MSGVRGTSPEVLIARRVERARAREEERAREGKRRREEKAEKARRDQAQSDKTRLVKVPKKTFVRKRFVGKAKPADLYVRPPKESEIPTRRDEFQEFALRWWEEQYGGKVIRYVSSTLPSPANLWKFHGVVCMPPKPIANRSNIPLFYLSLSHTPKVPRVRLGRVDDGVVATEVVTTNQVVVVCSMAGELAMRYGFLRVGTEVVASGVFGNMPGRNGVTRTCLNLQNLEVLSPPTARKAPRSQEFVDDESLNILLR